MKHSNRPLRIAATALLLWGISVMPAAAATRVKLETSQGSILIELFDDKAPLTAANFIQYAKDGFFDNTIFHRVIKGFMIQGGGLTVDLGKKDARSPIRNEADNGLKNARGTLAMARTQAPHSASSQFFINTKDNPFLDFKEPTQQGWGYCVFGRVIEGMDTVSRIEKVETESRDGRQDVPVKPVIIHRAMVMEPDRSKD